MQVRRASGLGEVGVRRLVAALSWLMGGAIVAVPAAAQGPDCTRLQFEAVVAEAAAALRDLNAHNRPTFQSKLRALKDKRGWSNDEFLRNASPLVQDAKTEQYDRESSEDLAKIQSMGAEGAAASEPNCAHLDELKARMQSLVTSQKAKWQYLFGKLEQELAK